VPRVPTPHKGDPRSRWQALRDLRSEIVAILVALIFALVLASRLI
jgi:hypothetical protein